jgi:hypothetical protein
MGDVNNLLILILNFLKWRILRRSSENKIFTLSVCGHVELPQMIILKARFDRHAAVWGRIQI